MKTKEELENKRINKIISEEAFNKNIKSFNEGFKAGQQELIKNLKKLDLNRNKKLVTANGELVMLILKKDFDELLKEKEVKTTSAPQEFKNER